MHNQMLGLAKKVMLSYYVIFKSKDSNMDYQPIIEMDIEESKSHFSNTMHQFDMELLNVLPAYWYILHLPRTGLDVQDLEVGMVKNSYDQPHNVISIPSWAVDIFCESIGNNELVSPTLIIYEDGCHESAKRLKDLLKPHLGSICISELSSELLKEHWVQIGNVMKVLSDALRLPDQSLRMLNFNENEYLVLPLLFLTNQLNTLSDILNHVQEKFNTFRDCYLYSLRLHTLLNTLVTMDEKGITTKEEIDKNYHSIFRSCMTIVELPVIITMPGIPNYQLKHRPESNKIPDAEKEVIRLLGTHRAVAKSGMLVELECVPLDLFRKLDTLESHCKRGGNNKYVWKSLKDIGNLLLKHIGQDQALAIQRASQITVFSDFPIGLAILPGTSAPLCCIKPISYRPLTPLTRALQFELLKQPRIFWGKKCKVIIAECLDKDDNIRPDSDVAWTLLQQQCKNHEGIDIIYSDVSSVNDLKVLLNQNLDADILLISAHGDYSKERNMAGLCIGHDVWMATENDLRVPPVVLLSACHVSPRGAGVVSVADLFLRAGAMTVLGTYIPVEVMRNAILMNRLFVYIQEAQKGSDQLKTFDEAWRFVVASNAIHEILESSSELRKWAITKRGNGTVPLIEFELKKSVGRLRNSHIYQDTITVLREISIEDGMEKHLDSVIKSQSYFPESVFYQMLGCPENVFLYNSLFDKL